MEAQWRLSSGWGYKVQVPSQEYIHRRGLGKQLLAWIKFVSGYSINADISRIFQFSDVDSRVVCCNQPPIWESGLNLKPLLWISSSVAPMQHCGP
jgi:hypothetical protein